MTQTQKYLLSAIVSVLLFAGAFLSFIALESTKTASGSTIGGQDYLATTTAANSVYGAGITASKLIKTGSGSFEGVVITGANTGIVNFYDATTTDISKRTNNAPTSTILIASFPASTAAGTYIFDVALNTGLYLDLVSGNMPTTTVKFRN